MRPSTRCRRGVRRHLAVAKRASSKSWKRFLKPRGHWDGRSRLLMLPVRKSKALLKCKSKRSIKSWTLGRNRSNHRTRHCRFCRSSSPSQAFSRSTLGQALPKCSDEPPADLHAVRRAMAEGVCRRYGVLGPATSTLKDHGLPRIAERSF
jgi:hypothetical protein